LAILEELSFFAELDDSSRTLELEEFFFSTKLEEFPFFIELDDLSIV